MNQSRQGTTEELKDRFVCGGLVRIQPKYFECTSIETSAWLKEIFGSDNGANNDYREWLDNKIEEDGISEYDQPYYAGTHEEYVKEWLLETTGTEYKCTDSDNTYNSEQDFYDQMVYQIYYPADARDWCWSNDCYVMINRHIGGDVRGNYRDAVLYGPVDNLAESGFIDWSIGWNVRYLFNGTDEGEPVEDEDRFQIGYASNPSYELQKHFKEYERQNIHGKNYKTTVTIWSDKYQGFLARYKDGRTVLCTPYVNCY